MLAIPAHVLRFWEGKFSQLRPMKRSGGRRYYRQEDIDILQKIKHLLYEDGYTIKGAQNSLSKRSPKNPATHQDAPSSEEGGNVDMGEAEKLLKQASGQIDNLLARFA